MRHSAASVLVMLVLTTTGCSGFFVFSNGTLLIAVTVDPAVADARSFPNFTVPFVATGSFSVSTAPVTLTNVLWTVESPFFNGGVPGSVHASIDQNGNATCVPGFTGSVLVFATVPLNDNLPVSIANNKVGSAKLICP